MEMSSGNEPSAAFEALRRELEECVARLEPRALPDLSPGPDFVAYSARWLADQPDSVVFERFENSGDFEIDLNADIDHVLGGRACEGGMETGTGVLAVPWPSDEEVDRAGISDLLPPDVRFGRPGSCAAMYVACVRDVFESRMLIRPDLDRRDVVRRLIEGIARRNGPDRRAIMTPTTVLCAQVAATGDRVSVGAVFGPVPGYRALQFPNICTMARVDLREALLREQGQGSDGDGLNGTREPRRPLGPAPLPMAMDFDE